MTLPETLPEILVAIAGVYLAVGALFAPAFAFAGAGKIDPDARDATWGFRLLVMPGAALLWPVLLRRWATGTQPREERTPHKRALEGGAR
ncbi:MAG: hypothetical protein AAF957_03160 [Planctomycetota bacterium]